MTTFVTRIEDAAPGRRLAVKDCIDVAGVPTTGGCRAVAAAARPAATDAACVRAARGAGLRVVGKSTLHELCHGGTGVNAHYGTPVNPRDPLRVPGGSSSGSAVAVATGEADVALGSDTSGSIRIPAAACGVAGLKTTPGLVPVAGVLPLAPTLDTVGPLAPDVAGLLAAVRWLLPSAAEPAEPATRILRVRTTFPVLPAIDTAVDDALRAAGYAVRDTEIATWARGGELADLITGAEAARTWGHLLDHPDLLGADVRTLLEQSLPVTDAELEGWHAEARDIGEAITRLMPEGTVLALPTLAHAPPLLADAAHSGIGELCGTPSIASLCALAMPVPPPEGFASLQLVGPPRGESTLLATAAHIEAALGFLGK